MSGTTFAPGLGSAMSVLFRRTCMYCRGPGVRKYLCLLRGVGDGLRGGKAKT